MLVSVIPDSEHRKISLNQAKEMAHKHKAVYQEADLRSGWGVQSAFMHITLLIFNKLESEK